MAPECRAVRAGKRAAAPNPLGRTMQRTPSARALLAAVAPLLLVVAVAAAAAAYPLPGRTERLTAGARQSWISSISAEGHFVAFQSYASDLIPGDTNGASDIFVADRETGSLERVSLSLTGGQANHHSYQPVITPDGRYVAFNSFASNLVAGDYNGHVDVFVRDRLTGVTERVSVASDGAEGHWTSGGSDGITGTYFSGRPAISDDGRMVAFWSVAKELDPRDENYSRDAFVHDRETGETELVSLSTAGQQGGNGEVISVDISGDGNVVAFAANYALLVPGDTNGDIDVFVHDLRTGVTERASVGTGGEQADYTSWGAALNYDGRFVAFGSGSTNLVPDDFNGGGGPFDVFVRDRLRGTTERLSVSSDGTEGNNASYHPQLSPDGRFVTFGSYASNLVPGDTNGTGDIFLYDRLTGGVQLVSMTAEGGQTSQVSGNPSLSADGAVISYETYLDDSVPGGLWDVFVREVGPPLGVGGLTATRDGGQATVSGFARFPGAPLASGSDPAGDGRLQGQDAGADLVGASLAYRPDLGDLRLRLDVSRLVRPGTAGHRGVVYGLAFRAGGVPYQVRASRLGTTLATPTVENGIALYRCASVPCTEVATLAGGIGTAGESVVVTLPLSLLGAGAPALSALRAFAGLGEMATGVPHELDAIVLGDAAPIPAVSLELAIGPEGSGEPGSFQPATLVGGRFGETLAAPGAGPFEVWSRTCLGDDCTTHRHPIEEE